MAIETIKNEENENEKNEKKKRCEELLLKEYESLVLMINGFYDTLQRGNIFYFTVLGIFITTFFLTINGNLESEKLIVGILTLFYIAITSSWYGYSERTYVKLMSKLERARHIEAYFAKEYGGFMRGIYANPKVFKSKHYSKDNFLEECFQNFTFTTKHLDENKDCKGKKLDFLTRRYSFFVTRFPFVLLIILLFGIILYYYCPISLVEF